MESTIDKAKDGISKSESAQKYLTFRLCKEFYGIDVLKIQGIIRIQNITALPQMPDYIKGIINLRGKVIPVIDLRCRFELPSHEIDEMSCIIIVQTGTHNSDIKLAGILVDGVEEVANVASTDIEDAPDFGNQLSADYILGVAKIKGGLNTLLDIDKVVSDAPIMQM